MRAYPREGPGVKSGWGGWGLEGATPGLWMCRSSGNWLGVGEAEGKESVHQGCSDLQAFSEAHVILRTGEKPSAASWFPHPWNKGYDSVTRAHTHTHTHTLSLSLSLSLFLSASQDTLENGGISPRRIHNNLLAMMSFKRDWEKWGRENSTLFASFSHGWFLFFCHMLVIPFI